MRLPSSIFLQWVHLCRSLMPKFSEILKVNCWIHFLTWTIRMHIITV
jgi:hypothetical protein